MKQLSKKIIFNLFNYLFKLWANLSVLLVIIMYLFWRLPVEAYADSSAGGHFYDNAFGWLLNFFTAGTVYYRLFADVVMPLLVIFFITAIAYWLLNRKLPVLSRQGIYGVALAVISLLLMLLTFAVAQITSYTVNNYRMQISEQYREMKSK